MTIINFKIFVHFMMVSLQKMYEEKKLCFLCDESDTIAEYEKSGRETNTDAYQQGISALQSIDRTQQVEVLTGNGPLCFKPLYLVE